MKDYYLETEQLAVGYDNKALIKEVSIRLKRGVIMALIGPNGSGKTTILKTITRLINPIHGMICIDGTSLTDMSGNEIAKKMSMVMTNGMQTEYLTSYDVVAAGRYPYTGRLGLLADTDKEKIEEALNCVGAKDLENQPFWQLSDGQKQRILLARAICQEPELIILDEPTSFLDIHYKMELLAILKRLAKEHNIAVLMTMHELELVGKISDQIICVSDGKIQCIGDVREVFTKENIMKLYQLDEKQYQMAFESDLLGNQNRENSYRYFNNTRCKYFPCHTGLKSDAFNCLFCYCPMNSYENCLGNPSFIEKPDGRRIKDCSGCTFPHEPEHYEQIMDFLRKGSCNE